MSPTSNILFGLKRIGINVAASTDCAASSTSKKSIGDIVNIFLRPAEINVEKITTDYEMNKAQSANVRSVPTVILIENEQEVRRFVGTRSYEQVMQFING